MLRRFFRPRWQHPDPRVRLEALDRLDPGQSDILARLVREDPDLDVRRAALQRLTDLELILTLTDDAQLGETARARFLECLPETVNSALLGRLPAPLVEHLAAGAPGPWRDAAVERLDDPEARLRLLAQTGDALLRRRLAAGLPDDLALLEKAHRHVRNRDKRLARELQSRIQALQAQARLPQEVAEARERLLTTLNGLRHLTSAEAIDHELARLQAAWDGQPLPADEDQAERWQRAWERVRAHRDELAEREARERARREALAVRESLCETLENLAEDLAGRDAMSAEDLQMAERMLAIQRQSWADRPPLDDEDEHRQRFQRALEAVEAALAGHRRRLEAAPLLERLEAEIGALEQADTPPDGERLAALGEQLTQLPELPERAALQKRLDRLARRLSEKTDLSALRRTLAHLERTIAEGHLHPARRAHQRLQAILATQPRLPRHLARRVEQAEARLEELAGWQQWATTPQKEKLVAEVEALADSDLPPQAILQQLKDARRAWRELGPAEPEAEARLSERFEAACARAYEPVRAWRERQRAAFERNRAAREAFLARLEGFLEQVDWNRVDWRRLAELERDIHREWRELGPTDRATREALAPRFRAVTRALHERLAEEWARNRAARQALISEANALLEMDDPEAALAAWRQLQRRWRETGPVAPRQVKPLARAFHEAGEKIVERWRAAKRETAQQRRQAIAAREAILRDMEALAEGLARGTADAADIARLEEAWNAAPQVAGKDWQRLEAHHRQLQARLERARDLRRRQARRQALVARLRHDLDLRRLEDLAGAGEQAATDLPLRNQPLEDEALEARRQAALAALTSGREVSDTVLERARDLILDLELALERPSPEAEHERRLARQVARLTRQLSGEAPEDEVEALLRAWLDLPPLPPGTWAELAPRWEALLAALGEGETVDDERQTTESTGEAAEESTPAT